MKVQKARTSMIERDEKFKDNVVSENKGMLSAENDPTNGFGFLVQKYTYLPDEKKMEWQVTNDTEEYEVQTTITSIAKDKYRQANGGRLKQK